MMSTYKIEILFVIILATLSAGKVLSENLQIGGFTDKTDKHTIDLFTQIFHLLNDEDKKVVETCLEEVWDKITNPDKVSNGGFIQKWFSIPDNDNINTASSGLSDNEITNGLNSVFLSYKSGQNRSVLEPDDMGNELSDATDTSFSPDNSWLGSGLNGTEEEPLSDTITTVSIQSFEVEDNLDTSEAITEETFMDLSNSIFNVSLTDTDSEMNSTYNEFDDGFLGTDTTSSGESFIESDNGINTSSTSTSTTSDRIERATFTDASAGNGRSVLDLEIEIVSSIVLSDESITDSETTYYTGSWPSSLSTTDDESTSSGGSTESPSGSDGGTSMMTPSNNTLKSL